MSTTDSTPDANENASEQGQDVSTIELFFDLVFVFAFTQVTGFLAHHLTWAGVAKVQHCSRRSGGRGSCTHG